MRAVNFLKTLIFRMVLALFLVMPLAMGSQPHNLQNLVDSKQLQITGDKNGTRFQVGGNSGGGGHEIGIEFVAVLRDSIEELKRVLPKMFQELSKHKLADLPSEVVVLAIDEGGLEVPNRVGIQDSVA